MCVREAQRGRRLTEKIKEEGHKSRRRVLCIVDWNSEVEKKKEKTKTKKKESIFLSLTKLRK